MPEFIKTPCLFYFRSVKFHYVKEKHDVSSLLALLKIGDKLTPALGFRVGFRVGIRVRISSWIFELHFELDFGVRTQSWFFRDAH